MQKRTQTVLSVCFLFVAVALAGCSTPIEKAYSLGTVYHQAQAEVINARQQNLIPNTVFRPIADADEIAEPLVQEAMRAAVQAETEQVPWNKTFEFNKAFDAARKAVRTLLIRLAEAQKAQK